MGTRLHEGSFACQPQRQPSDCCSGKLNPFICTVVVFYFVCLRLESLCTFFLFQTAKEYAEQLGVDSCIKLFEQFKTYEGLYFFLGSYLSSRYVFIVEEPLYSQLQFIYLPSPHVDVAVRILKYTSSILRLQPKLGKSKKWNV